MASSAGSAQTADSPETALVPWQPSREDAVPLGPLVDLNPFWSEKAKEEAQLKALRPKDLPEVEEEQGSLVSPGALPGGSIYHTEIPAGGLDEPLGAFKQVIAQNQALWQEMRNLKEQVREGGGSRAVKVPRGPGMGPGVDRPVPGGGVASDHGRDLLGLPGGDGVGAGPHQRAVGREGVAAESRVLPGPSDGRNGGHRGVPEEPILGSVEQMMLLEGFILDNLKEENLVVEVRVAEVGMFQEILLKELYYLARETGG